MALFHIDIVCNVVVLMDVLVDVFNFVVHLKHCAFNVSLSSVIPDVVYDNSEGVHSVPDYQGLVSFGLGKAENSVAGYK